MLFRSIQLLDLELNCAKSLISELLRKKIDLACIGVATTSEYQVNKLMNKEHFKGVKIMFNEFNSKKKIIIVLCKEILSDWRYAKRFPRLYTRAESQILIIGSKEEMENIPLLKKYMDGMEGNKCCVDIRIK